MFVQVAIIVELLHYLHKYLQWNIYNIKHVHIYLGHVQSCTGEHL